MQNDIKVSVICTAYNHENYIRDALESFVMQKTDFAFEVLVHDDASTDKTADIIREYEQKYPDIIKPIYQTINQYSKGVKIWSTYLFPKAQGRYIAICEGDDYWIDPCKLQKQYDALEQHPELDICAHAGDCVDAKTKNHLFYTAPSVENCIFSVEKVIEGGGGFVLTNCLMFRRNIMFDIPLFRQILSFDYTLQIHGALRGGMLYLKECMSAYRVMAQGSWTAQMSKNYVRSLAFREQYDKALVQLNKDTNERYSKVVQMQRAYSALSVRKICKKYLKMVRQKYRNICKSLPLRVRVKIWVVTKFPFLVRLKNYLKAKRNRVEFQNGNK